MTTTCDVAIMAHNEAPVIAEAIGTVLNQSLGDAVQLKNLLVASTASTDGTDEIVRELMARNSEVRLLVIPKRRGKAADVNEAVRHTVSPILMIMDADVLLSDSCITSMLEMLQADPDTGMVVPIRSVLNPRKGLMNRIGHLAAELQNVTERPKAGQIIAIRREYALVDERISVDDAYQEQAVLASGHRVVRAPGAVVLARAPTTLRDYLKQRRRVTAQYIALRRFTGYRPVTRSWESLICCVARTRTLRVERRIDVVLAAGLIDGLARTLGFFDHFVLGRSYATWHAANSTKNSCPSA